jgi:4-amino-4-deoxy-L-arabinose transferase-like glycosyltransferase
LTRPRFGHALATIVAIALILRVALVLATAHLVPRTDAADFDRLAVAVAQHGRFPRSLWVPGPTAFRPPLFPIALAGVYKVVGVGTASTRWEAGRLLEAGLGALAVLLIGLIALRLWGRRAALLAAAISAVYPPLVLVGSTLLSEPLFIALELAAVLAALQARGSPHRLRWSFACGVFVGLAGITRGNGLVLLIPLGFLLWSLRPRLSWRSLAAPAVMLVALALTLVPWTIRNASTFHQFIPISTQPGYATAGTYNPIAARETRFPALWFPPTLFAARILARHPHLNEAQLSSRLDTQAMHYAEDHPGYVAKVGWWTSLRLLNLTGPHFERWAAPYESYPSWLAVASVYAFWALWLLALAGAFTAAARRAPLALWGFPLVIFLSTVLLEGSTRYRSPADPFLVLLAALALLAVPLTKTARRDPVLERYQRDAGAQAPLTRIR